VAKSQLSPGQSCLRAIAVDPMAGLAISDAVILPRRAAPPAAANAPAAAAARGDAEPRALAPEGEVPTVGLGRSGL